MPDAYELIGRGLYSLREATRLTKIPRRTLGRWTEGYTYQARGRTQYTPPAVSLDIDLGGEVVLSFSALIEVRFLEAFRRHGVSWKAIRIAAEKAKQMLGRLHPFSTRIFLTDGRTIIAEIARGTGSRSLLDLVHDQFELDKVIEPYLYEGLDFNHLQEPERWWPLGRERQVMIDPGIALGSPVIQGAGIPTHNLAQAFGAEGSYEIVARIYEVSAEAVRDAVEFEAALAS